MKKSIKQFEIKKDEDRPCNICNEIMKKNHVSSLRMTTWDTSHHYRGSNRPFIMNYKLLMCEKCFRIIVNKIEKTIEAEANK